MRFCVKTARTSLHIRPLGQGSTVSESLSSLDVIISRVRYEPELLGELLQRYRAFLTLVTRQRIGRDLAARCSASDVVQMTFTEAMEAFKDFNGSTEPAFSAWIKQIHDRNLHDLLRKHVVAERRSVIGFSDFRLLSRVGLVPRIAEGAFHPELQDRHSDSTSQVRSSRKS